MFGSRVRTIRPIQQNKSTISILRLAFVGDVITEYHGIEDDTHSSLCEIQLYRINSPASRPRGYFHRDSPCHNLSILNNSSPLNDAFIRLPKD